MTIKLRICDHFLRFINILTEALHHTMTAAAVETPSPYEQIIDDILENQEPPIKSATQQGMEISPGRLGYSGRFEFSTSSGLMLNQEISFSWKAGDAQDRHIHFRLLFYALVSSGAIDPIKVDPERFNARDSGPAFQETIDFQNSCLRWGMPFDN